MIEYVKIETPFNRDTEGTKKLIEGSWRNSTVDYLKDCQWDWEEKLDGMNTQIYFDGHTITFGGRTERAQIPADLMNYLIRTFGGETNEELFEQKFGEMGVILFGEGYGPKIQKGGGLYRDDVSFALFDVYIPEKDIWMKRESVADIAKTFNISTVPHIGQGTIQEAINFVKTQPRSRINEAHEMEGVVARPLVELKDNQGKRVIVKIKVRDFV